MGTKKISVNKVPLMPEEFKSGIEFFVKYNGTMTRRIDKYGWSVERSFLTPVRNRKDK